MKPELSIAQMVMTCETSNEASFLVTLSVTIEKRSGLLEVLGNELECVTRASDERSSCGGILVAQGL